MLFINRGTRMKIAPPPEKNLGVQNVYFWSEIQIRRLWTAAAHKRGRIQGKLKQYLGYLTSAFGEIWFGRI